MKLGPSSIRAVNLLNVSILSTKISTDTPNTYGNAAHGTKYYAKLGGTDRMKIGIIGSGIVGRTLAGGLLSRGNDIVIGSREPKKLQEFVDSQHGKIRASTLDETARFGEIVILATLFTGTREAIDLAGPENLSGKVVIDTTNPLKFEQGKSPELLFGFSTSAGEDVQRWIPDARVVKAFNTIGSISMVDPMFLEGPPTMFIAGNDLEAKKLVTKLVESLGWNDSVFDVGGIEESRLLEPLAMLWVRCGLRSGSWNHAFRLLHA